ATEEPSCGHLCGHCGIGRYSDPRKSLIGLVGAGRFERPTPCAQRVGMAFNGSIPCGLVFMLKTTLRIFFLVRSNLKALKAMGFWHSFDTVRWVIPSVEAKCDCHRAKTSIRTTDLQVPNQTAFPIFLITRRIFSQEVSF